MLEFLETEAGMYVAVSLALLVLVALLIAFLSWRQRVQKRRAAAVLPESTKPSSAAITSLPPLPAITVLSHALLRATMATTYLTPQWNGPVPASSLSDDDLCFLEATSEKVAWHTIIGGEWPYLCGRMNHALNYRMPSFTPDAYAGPLRTHLQP